MESTRINFVSLDELNNIVFDNITFEEALKLICIDEKLILYVINKEKKLLGVITIGDLDNYYYHISTSFINSNYKFLDSLNEKNALDALNAYKTISQVPVILKGDFIGIYEEIRKTNQTYWINIREHFYEITSIDKIREFYLKQAQYIFPKIKQVGVDIYIVDYPLEVDKKICKNTNYIKKNKLPSNMNGFLQMSESQQQDFYKEDYYLAKANKFAQEYNQLSTIVKNGRTIFSDLKNDSFHICDGHRLVPNAPSRAKHRIYLIGSCNVLGAYVTDNRTIGYYLQNYLNIEFNNKYEVVISATIGNNDLSGIFCEEYRAGDKVICFFMNPQLHTDVIEYVYKSEIAEKISISKAYDFNNTNELIGNLFNGLMHHNHLINQKIAECIMSQLSFESHMAYGKRKQIQNYYIRYEIVDYYTRQFLSNNFSIPKQGVVGAIVMNGNPFTYGHRYLIEYALGKVDLLYIFVVQEDSSIFSFNQRFEMVKRGTEEFSKVRVLPSGKYIISKETFTQYFHKDQEVQVIEDMDYDVHIFGEVVSPIFGIEKRFVGEEPFDLVTKKYNETMKKILPQCGVQLKEIPRLTVQNGEVVSATKVRELLKKKEWGVLSKFLPDSTIEILKQ